MPYTSLEKRRKSKDRYYVKLKNDPTRWAEHLKRAAARAKHDYRSGRQRERQESSAFSWFGHRLSMTKHRKSEKRIRWSVKVDTQFVVDLWERQKGECALTGIQMQLKFGSPFAASIDRIDSKRDYTKSNIQIVSHAANLAKYTFTMKEFNKWLKAVKKA